MNKMRLQESVVLFAAKDRCNWVFFFDPSFGLCLLGLEDFDTGVKYSPQLSFGLESASVFHADHSPIQKGNGRHLQGFHHLFCVSAASPIASPVKSEVHGRRIQPCYLLSERLAQRGQTILYA